MIKVALVCDNCGSLISGGISANEVRFQAEALYRRREGKDLCLACEGAALATAHGSRSSRRGKKPATQTNLKGA
jgi:hypothetical protein